MTSKIIIGIDPGLQGGIALLDVTNRELYAQRMPVRKAEKKTIYDIEALTSLLDYDPVEIAVAVLERVNTMPGQGIASNGKLMYGFGLLHGLIAKYNHVLISARSWKKHFSLNSDKDLSREKAGLLFPQCNDCKLWHTKNRDGIAEAAILAVWGLQHLNLCIDTASISHTRDKPSSIGQIAGPIFTIT